MTIILNGTTGVTFPDGTTQTDGLATPIPVADGGTGSTTAAFSGANITSLNASNIASGTVPTARLGSGTANNTTFLRGDSTFATISAGLPGLGGQVFTSNGTFTIPAGVTRLKVTVVGGGGGGRGDSDGVAGGAGGGGAAIKFLTGLTPGNTLSVTVGGGGSGGAPGTVGNTGGTSQVASGTQSITTVSASGGTSDQLGGIGSNGDANIRGGAGTPTYNNSPGTGGGTILGGSGRSGSTTSVFGGGGSGGQSSAGTAGAAGIVMFEF